VGEEEVPLARQLHAAGRSHEERRAELVFEPADLPADGGLRDPQRVGSASYVPFLRDGDEVLDLSEAHVDRLARVCAGAHPSGGAAWGANRVMV
jgi:hypothetical protein